MLRVDWIDHRREPTQPPNPDYPLGIDLDVSKGKRSCSTALPYPAKRCGAYVITCDVCGMKAVATTAGRPDDPRSIRIPCDR